MARLTRLAGGRSLVFRLWFTLNAIFLAAAIAATAAYVFVTIDHEIEVADEEIALRQETLVLFSRMTRRALQSQNIFTFTDPDFEALRGLGVQQYDLLDSEGEPLVQIQPNNGLVLLSRSYVLAALASSGAAAAPPPPQFRVVPEIEGLPIDMEQLSAAKATGESSRTLDFEGGIINQQERRVSVVDILRGRSYMKELWFADDPERIQRTFVAYPDLTTEARSLARNASLVMLLLFAVSSVSSWLLLRRMVYHPLKEYSSIAVAIAGGQPVRLRVDGRNEIADLALAVNGMADVLESKAAVDTLTGLYNLRHMSDRLETLVMEASTAEQPLSVLMADLDRFKPVNDTFGHAAGDTVLKAVGATIRSWAASDFVCWRAGGDEFVIAMPNRTYAEALQAGQRLQRQIAHLVISVSDGIVRTNLSVGVATMPEDGASPGALIGVADRQMYQNKEDNRRRRETRLSA